MATFELRSGDLAIANTLLLRNLIGWLVASGTMPAQKVDGLVQMTARHLISEGHGEASRAALLAFFGEGVTNYLKNMELLLKDEPSSDLPS